VRLLDTAGLRQTSDPVEQEGIKRARASLITADLVIHVRDVCEAGSNAFARAWLGEAKQVLTVGNKIDLQGPYVEGCDVLVSAVTQRGLPDLRSKIISCLGFDPAATAFTARERHVTQLELAREHVRQATALIESNGGAEITAEELRLAHQCLGQIAGRVSADELLGDIFSTFCIGK
jgi:tRNA modification GTPase